VVSIQNSTAGPGALALLALLPLVSPEPRRSLQDPEPQEPPGQEPGPGEFTGQEPAPGAPAEQPAGTPEPEPAPRAPAESGAPPGPAYRFLEDRDALLASWSQSGLVERLTLGTSAGGRELFGIQFGAQGERPLTERATILLLGGLDGVSLSGSEAVIAVVDQLLARPERLPPDAAFVAIPWANPDGLARWRSLACGGGRNDSAIDDDRDGRTDEDGPDDLDRDGNVLEMLLEDPAGQWVRSADPRFLRPAREGEAPRFLRLREGRDDDGDGRFNEDGPGGVVLDHNFPVEWEGPWRGVDAGPWPLSEPDSRAIAMLALARRTALVLAFQGSHGQLASPGGKEARPGALALPLAEDEPTYRALVELFAAQTGRIQERALPLRDARGEPWPGSVVDWAYQALGALAMEVGVWGPTVQGDGRVPVDAYFRDPRPASDDVPPSDQAWARWLDETRGGIGFVEWQPIELPGASAAWVGGWEPHTCYNPPTEVLPEALHGLGGFVFELSQNLPRLEIDLREWKREGRVCLIRVRVRNLGALPSGVGPGARGRGLRLVLELPAGAVLLAGELESGLEHLPGKGTSAEYRWLLTAPEDSLFRISAESNWSPPCSREVRL
jgi:hypothetical protein